MLIRVYRQLFVVVFALYVYFNRGIAYTYLAEMVWFLGLLLMARNWKAYLFPWDRKVALLVFFLLVSFLYMIIGAMRYPILEVIRDGFMFNYMLFVFIIPLFKDNMDAFKKSLFNIYKWLPFVVLAGILVKTKLLDNTVPSFFGGIPILEYKNGDLAVQLLITALLLITGRIQYSLRFQFLNAMVVFYLFFLVATFNRGGMLAFVMGLLVFLYFARGKFLQVNIRTYLSIAALLLCVALPLYMLTNIKDPVQGRNTGIEQLQKNVTSIFVKDDNTPLSGNIIWRLAWWGKILDYTLAGPYFLTGKGLGPNLAVSDGIPMEDNNLRSPHSFHLNVLARFGVPIAMAWLAFLFFLFREFRKKDLDGEQLMYLSILLAFVINASFDVALEGPMSAFPCWTFFGILFFTQLNPKTSLE